MVELFSGITSSMSFGVAGFTGMILGFFINALVTTIAIIIADKIIVHNIEIKHAFMMTIGAYFLTPVLLLALKFANMELPSFLIMYIIPLIVWIVLGELLLSAGRMAKLKVAILAFVINLILMVIDLPGMIYAMF